MNKAKEWKLPTDEVTALLDRMLREDEEEQDALNNRISEMDARRKEIKEKITQAQKEYDSCKEEVSRLQN